MSFYRDKLIERYNHQPYDDLLAEIHEINAQEGLNYKDFEYLEEYVKILEKEINNEYYNGSAQADLNELNNRLACFISAKTYKKYVATKQDLNESWSSSDCGF